MPIDAKEFRRLLGHFAAGVTIITTTGKDAKPYGLTATAFCSVSLDPPLVLICVDKKAESHLHVEASGSFAVNLLTQQQIDLSNRFAKSGGDKFEGIDWKRGSLDLPLLPGALAHLECRSANVIDAGDHTIFLGRVEAGSIVGGEPLLHFNGAYRALMAAR